MAFDRSVIEAKLALRRISPDEMPALAWDALEAGADGPSIRRLAALVNPSGWEVDQLLPRFMAEAELERIPRQEAALRLARQAAGQILSRGLDPLEHTRAFEQLWFEGGYSSALQDAGTLRDDEYLFKIDGKTQEQIREHARRVLFALVNNP